MAEGIITNWKLAVLRAWLDYSERSPAISTRLDGYVSAPTSTTGTRHSH